ncbi:MAG TPA: T9SS type A sorting domain-containing protein [bacterium]|jgi:hypothetical protein
MRVRSIFVLLTVLAVCGFALAKLPKNVRLEPIPARTGLEEAVPAPANTVRGPARHSLDDPIGTVDTVGYTWYDEQQYTTCGKQIAVDHEGYVHNVWTNGRNETSSDRHIYYNVWDPTASAFVIPSPDVPTGAVVDAAYKSGYANVTVNREGIAFPTFHQVLTNGAIAHTAVGIDFAPRLGVFTVHDLPYFQDKKIIYPKIGCDIDGNLHLTATEGTPGNFGYYAKGHPYFTNGNGDSINWPDGMLEQDSTFYLSRDIAVSYRSNRVAMAWIYFDWRSWYGMNVFLKTSEDGGATWDAPINVTNFPVIDTNCVNNGGNIAACNQDTMRPYIDMSVVFDQNDVVHLAFMARGFYYWDETGAVGPWLHNDGVSSIWHWDELHQEFNIIAERPYGTLDHGLGRVQTMVQRPSLAVDTTTGFLYCSYQAFDTAQYSEGGYLQSDAWVSVSTSGGRMWSEGTNVTNSNGGQNTAVGQCVSERDINLAQFVTDGTIHMQYELDLDAGTAINSTPEGSPTHNPILYQRIPAEQIPARPYINPYRVLRLDSTGFPRDLDTTLAVGNGHRAIPGEFTLYQNYPNPFNPTTTIQFDLMSQSTVSLKVFDVLGRQVATLLDNARLGAGVQLVPFDASSLASGIYLYRLETPTVKQTRKMVLMK